MRHQRRVGELITICSGIAMAVGGVFVNVPPVAYGLGGVFVNVPPVAYSGLCIMGLGVISVFWR